MSLCTILKGDPELVKKQSLLPPTKKRGVKRSFSDAGFEARIIEFVKRSK
ncbi:MAG: hypothetical protein V3U12_02460 [Nitrosopumilaceae archaeon]